VDACIEPFGANMFNVDPIKDSVRLNIADIRDEEAMRTLVKDQDIIFNKRGIGYFVSSDGVQITRKLFRSNFVRNELPQLCRTLKLLDMDFEEFYSLYTHYQEKRE